MQILSKHEKLTVQHVQHYVTKYATTSLELKVAKKNDKWWGSWSCISRTSMHSQIDVLIRIWGTQRVLADISGFEGGLAVEVCGQRPQLFRKYYEIWQALEKTLESLHLCHKKISCYITYTIIQLLLQYKKKFCICEIINEKYITIN